MEPAGWPVGVFHPSTVVGGFAYLSFERGRCDTISLCNFFFLTQLVPLDWRLSFWLYLWVLWKSVYIYGPKEDDFVEEMDGNSFAGYYVCLNSGDSHNDSETPG